MRTLLALLLVAGHIPSSASVKAVRPVQGVPFLKTAPAAVLARPAVSPALRPALAPAAAPLLAPAAAPLAEPAAQALPALQQGAASVSAALEKGPLQAAPALDAFYGVSRGAASADLPPGSLSDGRSGLQPSPKLWAPATLETPLAGDSMAVTVHRLSNGMTVYLSPNKTSPRVTGYVAVRAGARQDATDSTGMAHYLEHMLFKGTEKLGSLDYAKEKVHLDAISALYERLFAETDPAARAEIYKRIDAENQEAAKYAVPNEFDRLYSMLGFNEINAHTHTEETVYKVSFPAKRAEAWARTEADRFANPVFRLFLSEIEAVYQEFNKGADSADEGMFNKTEQQLWAGHPYERDTIGLQEHLKNPSLKKMGEYYDAWYRPENMSVILAGDFERGEMLELLERNFGALKSRTPKTPAAPAAELPPLVGERRGEVKFEAEESLLAAWRMPKAGHPDAPAATLIDVLLSHPSFGLINLDLLQTQKVKEASAMHWVRNEASSLYVQANPLPGQTLEEAEALALGIVEKLKAGAFTAADLAAAVTALESQEKRSLESDTARVDHMFRTYIHGREWADAAADPARLRAVTREDVIRVANAYLGKARVITYRRKGESEKPKMEKPSFTPLKIDPTRQTPFWRDLAATPAAERAPRWLEKGKDFVVSSGRSGRLYWAKNPVSDLFSATFVIPGGARADKRLGMAAELFDASGAGDLSPADLEKRLARLGTEMSMRCGFDECAVNVSGLEKNLEESLRLLDLRLTKPNVPAGLMAKLVEVELGSRQDIRQDPDQIGKALREYAERGSQSGLLAHMTEAEVKALKLKDLRRSLASLASTRRDTYYVGSKSAADAARLTTSRRSYRRAPAPARKRIQTVEKPRVLFVHRDMVQAHVGVFSADVPVGPEEAVARKIFSTVQGGMNGVFFQELREARSLGYATYGGYVTPSRAGDDGENFGWIGVEADRTVEAATLIGEIMKRPSVPAERFEAAKSEVLELYKASAIPFRGLPSELRNWRRLGLGIGDPRPALLARAETFTNAELDALAARVSSRPLTYYVVGDRTKVDLEGLKALGDFREVSLDDIFPR